MGHLFGIPGEEILSMWPSVQIDGEVHLDRDSHALYQKVYSELLLLLWRWAAWGRGDMTERQMEAAYDILGLRNNEISDRLARYSDCAVRQRREATKDQYGRNQRCCLPGRDSDSSSHNQIPLCKDPSKPYVCPTCYKCFSDKRKWKAHENKNWPLVLYICPIGSCPKDNKLFIRKDSYQKHCRKWHREVEPSTIHPDRAILSNLDGHDRMCVFRNCNAELGTRRERIDHLAQEFGDPNRRWTQSDWRDSNATEDEEQDDNGDDDDEDDEDDEEDTNEDESDDEEKSPHREEGAARGLPRRDGSQRKRHRDQSPRSKGRKMQKRRSSSGAAPGQETGKSEAVAQATNIPQAQGDASGIAGEPRLSNEHQRPGCGYCHTELLADKTSHLSIIRTVHATDSATILHVRCGSACTDFVQKIVHFAPPSQLGVRREAIIMEKLQHPHIVRYISSSSMSNRLSIAMVPVADTDLRNYMRHERHLTVYETVPWQWFSCLASALCYIHERGIRHQDIKPSNILVSNNTVLIADFGLSNLTSDEPSHGSNIGFFTRQYVAPEFRACRRNYENELSCNCYRGKASDVWALGFVFLELLTYLVKLDLDDVYLPPRSDRKWALLDRSYANNQDAVKEWLARLRLLLARQSDTYPGGLKLLDVCRRMTNYEHTSRPTAGEVAKLLGNCSHIFWEPSGAASPLSTWPRLALRQPRLPMSAAEDVTKALMAVSSKDRLCVVTNPSARNEFTDIVLILNPLLEEAFECLLVQGTIQDFLRPEIGKSLLKPNTRALLSSGHRNVSDLWKMFTLLHHLGIISRCISHLACQRTGVPELLTFACSTKCKMPSDKLITGQNILETFASNDPAAICDISFLDHADLSREQTGKEDEELSSTAIPVSLAPLDCLQTVPERAQARVRFEEPAEITFEPDIVKDTQGLQISISSLQSLDSDTATDPECENDLDGDTFSSTGPTRSSTLATYESSRSSRPCSPTATRAWLDNARETPERKKPTSLPIDLLEMFLTSKDAIRAQDEPDAPPVLPAIIAPVKCPLVAFTKRSTKSPHIVVRERRAR